MIEKKKTAQLKLNRLEESARSNSRKLIRDLCGEIINDLITISLNQSLVKEDFIIDTRENALSIAKGKIVACENQIKLLKRGLEKEALIVFEKKNKLVSKAKSIEEKAENIEVISKTIGKSDRNILKSEDNLRKREELYVAKVKQIELLEKQLEDRDQIIIEKERKKFEFTPEKRKYSDNSHLIKENALKQKENELNNRSKNLEDKKKLVEEYKSKIRWRLNNISSLEKKSEKLKSATEAKIQEFNIYVQTENAKIDDWKERNKLHENSITSLKEKSIELEKALKEREHYIEHREFTLREKAKQFDSIEEFIQIEKQYEVGSNEYSSLKFTDFAKSFQLRQIERKKEYDEISKEKKKLSEKITSILNL